MRFTVAEINTDFFRHNLAQIRARVPDTPIMAMVKANAYGHGIVKCSQILREEGVEMLGVAFANEAIMLRNTGDRGTIVVMTPPEAEEAEFFAHYDLQAVASSLEVMVALSNEFQQQGKVLKAHLYIDTGMRRDGIQPDEAVEFMRVCSVLKNVEMIGVCTHFATSDDADKSFVTEQLECFKNCVELLKEKGFEFQYIHTANTGAIADLSESYFNLIRPGISLYGYHPSDVLENPMDLKPVMQLKTRIISLRRIPAGESVSYARRYFTTDETTIGSIPIGYGDGFPRALTNRAEVLIRGKRYNQVGAICMDQCMVDLGDEDIHIGEEVVLLGKQGSEEITAAEIA
ncbi:MAG TPA: alanine racemase, partial [Patescibacteria group bacterium]|nr:alanine racemase [Patescibacteria group bacterium]